MSWQIEITSDSMKALLKLAANTPDLTIDADEVLNALRERGVTLDEQTTTNIRTLVEALPNQTDGKPVLLLQGTPAIPGKNGYFEWDQACDPQKHKEALAQQEELDRRSYYGVSNLIIVKKGDVLGKLYPPTQGQPGQDVLGRQIPPQPGTEHKLEPGKNVHLRQDACTFQAQCDGEPCLTGPKLEVDPVLNIKGNVDFATGNISYSGEVLISGDIKDLFTVRSGGDITVGGTVEAATIDSGGSLNANRGIFGKEKGTLKVANQLTARYLSNVAAWVKGDVNVGAEIVNTYLNSAANVLLEKGAIHGGKITATGSIEAPVLGSPAGVRTIIRAALDPFAEQELQALDDKHEHVTDTLATLVRQAKTRLAARAGKPDQKLKDMAAQIEQLKNKLQKIDSQINAVKQKMYASDDSAIRVHKMIHPGTILCVGRGKEMVEHLIHGPLEIIWAGEEAGPALRFRAPAQLHA